MMRSILTIIFAFTLPLAAQSGPARKISLNLCCLRFAGEVRSLALKSEPAREPVEVPFYQGGFTEPVPALVEDGGIIVYKKGDAGEQPWVPDWSIPVRGGGSSLSVILMPASGKDERSGPYTAFHLPPPAKFPYGSVLAVNLTPLKARLDLGAQKLALPPGASASARLESEVDAYNMLPVTAWIESEGKWLTLHTTKWAYNPRYRQVSLLWMDPAVKRPEITSIRDVVPLPAADE